MKLRFYLRGLGIGIAVTALVLGLAGGRKQTLTDAEIMARAESLGMVQEDKLLLQPAETPASEETAPAEQEAAPKEQAQPETEQVAEPKEQAEQVAEPKEQAQPETEPVTEPVTESEASANSTYTLEISSGSSSDTVSALLKKGGLVDSAEDFDSYLCRNGYDNRITAGKHQIPAGADYKTIAEIITSK